MGLSARGAMGSSSLSWANPLNLSPGPLFSDWPVSSQQPRPGSLLSYNISRGLKQPHPGSLPLLLPSQSLPCFTVPSLNKRTLKIKTKL